MEPVKQTQCNQRLTHIRNVLKRAGYKSPSMIAKTLQGNIFVATLKRKDGTLLADKEAVGLSNNVLYSLFESVVLYVGFNQQEIYIPHYSYKHI